MNQRLELILTEVEKAIAGKREVVEKVLMALLSGGHILLDDVPGVGKTTLAVAISRALGLRFRRVQFTPDVLPSDLVGFTLYDRAQGQMRYVPGAVSGVHLLLGDEINRTSSKTQSALLEAMEERQVTVDGERHALESPFCVIATQNRVGAAGTQPLPHAQMDRFLVRLSIGYPDYAAQMEILRSRKTENPLEEIQRVADVEAVLEMQRQVRALHMDESLMDYITRLCMATREHPSLRLGVSPRGVLSLSRMACACAFLHGRDYVIVEDVQEIFSDVCAHRVILSQKAQLERRDAAELLLELLQTVKLPNTL